jgi:lipoprotein-anchoring transpeptidase ErfK/SrfK
MLGVVMHTISLFRSAAAVVVIAAATSFAATASASPFLPFAPPSQPAPMMQAPADEGTDDTAELPARFKRQIVDYRTTEAPGTIVIDTPNTYLYFVLGNGRALRYGIGVGREGFTWSGVQNVTKKAEWPDWTPPPEMIERQPYLPRFMAGGPGNPLGARAMYLGGSIYRIHGTNDPSTIGHRVSSGCIRLTNDDVSDLYGRVNVGTKVVVI